LSLEILGRWRQGLKNKTTEAFCLYPESFQLGLDGVDDRGEVDGQLAVFLASFDFPSALGQGLENRFAYCLCLQSENFQLGPDCRDDRLCIDF